MRIGIGYDVHKLVKKRKLIVGGVAVPHSAGLLGWSDGDVLLHAVIDALIGALGEGDIGRHFPPGTAEFKNISSLTLLARVKTMLSEQAYAINNIDATVVAEEPKLAPYIASMKAAIAGALEIEPGLVNIKGKTEEGLGFTGAKHGIKAYAICLIHKEI
ncbi:MAG: 2-C-methyl-D-erythritol 2,4-cyclodiphosphate synthase [Candidatus Saganbacteria bacterium]|nr:2-C-methyl-D-erythritol 2,4-cyclodiphosphate synthase [Candidatus Saganbacteria bacterium]